jgi:hypothetical protein
MGEIVYLTRKTLDILEEYQLQYGVDTYNDAIQAMEDHINEVSKEYNRPADELIVSLLGQLDVFGSGKHATDSYHGYDLRTISAFTTGELVDELKKRRCSK